MDSFVATVKKNAWPSQYPSQRSSDTVGNLNPDDIVLVLIHYQSHLAYEVPVISKLGFGFIMKSEINESK
jgi:hypothetical protein